MPLSSKDLHYLKDELSWELLAMKKCHHFAQEAQDPQVRQLIDRVGRIHQQHYEILLSQLQSEVQTAGIQPQPPAGGTMTQ
ncbi:hypothetical protein JIR001_06600 [Polycladomyces abyssicola]|jgi:hypothetical protein|uniref:Spore coat protein n=1 Tax=Polycladomyces abyssicola TaxID=1125966 RepID=A0A8D5UCU3_9BACL|nr:hypothetical protein [Polycladomyces abyssicola]BCU80877.1 hypothetical protein JIR001_06600 [Polycladomyces abyssicola]